MRAFRNGTARAAWRVLVAWVVLLFASVPALAHEVRPAYLELREAGPGEFRVHFRTPSSGGVRLDLVPEVSGETRAGPAAVRGTDRAEVRTWTLRADPLRGRTIRMRGLEATMTDALVRVEFADGTTWTDRLTPGAPAAAVPVLPTPWSVVRSYFSLGVEHILAGIDHLLFVLALTIVTRGGGRLVRTVTAFTVSHSVTLTLAALGWVRVPPPPVEAVIALSIVFVAAEILRGERGASGITARAPWVVAFAFGLLHGLGFAGGLTEAGLPEAHVPLALLVFSAGVEAGHLLFVGAVLAVGAVASRVVRAGPVWTRQVPAYAIGATATFWLFQRVADL